MPHPHFRLTLCALPVAVVAALCAPGAMQPPTAAQPGAKQPAAMPAAATLRVAAVQMRSSRDLAANVARIQKAIQQCAKDGVRVVAFPECALTGYFADLIPTVTAEALADAE